MKNKFDLYISNKTLIITQSKKTIYSIERSTLKETYVQLTDKNYITSFDFILGLYKYESQTKENYYFLVVITDYEKFDFFNICRIKSFEIINLTKNPKKDETDHFIKLLKTGLNHCFMYFSDNYNLTLTFQQQFQDKESRQIFIWNYEAIQCLNNICPNAKKLTKEVIAGFFQKVDPFVLIIRKSNKNCGCHSWSRGVDIKGNAANFLENEEIMILGQNKDEKEISKSKICAVSHFEISASCPILWSKYPTMQLSRSFQFGPDEENERRFNLHFDHLYDYYIKQTNNEQTKEQLRNEEQNEEVKENKQIEVQQIKENTKRNCGEQNKEIKIIEYDKNENKENDIKNNNEKRNCIEQKINNEQQKIKKQIITNITKEKQQYKEEHHKHNTENHQSDNHNGECSLYIISLLNNHGKELKLNTIYKDLAKKRGIRYKHIKFNHLLKNPGSLSHKIKKLGNHFDACVVKDGKIINKQTKIIRVNCSICLDRTNIFMEMIFQCIFKKSDETTFSKNIEAHKMLWYSRAEVTSKDYALTCGMKTYLIEGDYKSFSNKYFNYIVLLKRYICSLFYEGEYCDAYNAVLQERPFMKFDDICILWKIILFIQLLLLFIYMFIFNGRELASNMWKKRIKIIIDHPHIEELLDAYEYYDNSIKTKAIANNE